MIQLVDTGVLHVIADLREVTFLDSTALGALVGSLKRLRARGGSLTLVTSADRILRIFRITGLHHVFVLRQSVQEAITTGQRWQAAVTGDGHTIEEWCGKHGLL